MEVFLYESWEGHTAVVSFLPNSLVCNTKCPVSIQILSNLKGGNSFFFQVMELDLEIVSYKWCHQPT